MLGSETPGQSNLPELLFSFFIERTKTFWHCELWDRGADGIEAQFLDPTELRFARTFLPHWNARRTPREMAIEWATNARRLLQNEAT